MKTSKGGDFMLSFYKKEIEAIRTELKKELSNADNQVVSVSAEALQFLLKTPLPNDRMIAAVKCSLSKIEPNQTTARMKAVDARHICDWFDCCIKCIEAYGAMNTAVAMMLLFSSKNYRISVSRFFDDLRKATKALINQEEVTDTIGAFPDPEISWTTRNSFAGYINTIENAAKEAYSKNNDREVRVSGRLLLALCCIGGIPVALVDTISSLAENVDNLNREYEVPARLLEGNNEWFENLKDAGTQYPAAIIVGVVMIALVAESEQTEGSQEKVLKIVREMETVAGKRDIVCQKCIGSRCANFRNGDCRTMYSLGLLAFRTDEAGCRKTFIDRDLCKEDDIQYALAGFIDAYMKATGISNAEAVIEDIIAEIQLENEDSKPVQFAA